MNIYYATTNAGKLATMRRDLSQFGITVSPLKLDITELQAQQVETIARYKVLQAYHQLLEERDFERKVACQDSGLCINALGGWPGAYVKSILDNEQMGLDAILRLLEGKTDRSCEFHQCIAYSDPLLDSPILFKEVVKGKISYEKRGTLQDSHWSKLALIFVPEGETRTHAEMSPDEYLAYKNSQGRERAGEMLGRWLIKNRTDTIN